MTDREKKKKRFPRTKIGFYLVNIILGIIILLLIAGIAAFILCQEEEVVVKGSTIYTEAEVKQAVLTDAYSKRNCVYAVAKNMIEPKTDIPFIDSVDVTMTGRNTLQITVHETEMAGYFQLSDDAGYAYFNADGVITDVSERLVEGLTLLEGVSQDTVSIGDDIPLDSSGLKAVKAVFANLEKNDITVSKVTISEEGELTAQHDNVLINLGTRSNLEEKIKRLPYILSYLEGYTGTLHLENWTEDNTDIVFQYTE